MKFPLIPVVAALASLASSAAIANPLNCDKSYAFRVDVGATFGNTLCDSKATTFIDSLSNFNSSNTIYTTNSVAHVVSKFSDVHIFLDYNTNGALPGGTTLNYDFQELGVSGSFTGTTRKESQKLLEDYIKKNGIVGQIMNWQSKNSPTSPITGAGGLIPMTIAGDFNSAFTNSPTSAAAPANSGSSSNNLVGVGISYGSYNIDNSADRVSTTSIPVSYTIRNEIDPRQQLSFSLPVTLVEVGDAKTVHTGLGLSYRVPMNDNWTITPGARYSVVASADRATVSTLYSASVTSTYVIPMTGFDVAIGNMLGYYATGKFSSGEYSFDPGIKNAAMRNGVMLSQPVNFGSKMTIEYSLIDTRYFGDKPFIDNFQEIGVTLGTSKSALDARSFIRGGLTYMQGPGTRGFTANLGYWF